MKEFDLESLMVPSTNQVPKTQQLWVDAKEACLVEAGELQFLLGKDELLQRVVEIGTLVDVQGQAAADALAQQPKGGVTVYKVCLSFPSGTRLDAICRALGSLQWMSQLPGRSSKLPVRRISVKKSNFEITFAYNMALHAS